MNRFLAIALCIGIPLAIFLGISTTELWDYIIDFTKVVASHFAEWITAISDSFRAGLKNSLGNSNSETVEQMIKCLFIK